MSRTPNSTPAPAGYCDTCWQYGRAIPERNGALLCWACEEQGSNRAQMDRQAAADDVVDVESVETVDVELL